VQGKLIEHPKNIGEGQEEHLHFGVAGHMVNAS